MVGRRGAAMAPTGATLLMLFCSAVLAEAPQVKVACPSELEVFQFCELRVSVPDVLKRLPATQLHDAYDADRDGRYARLTGDFRHGDQTVTVPGFALRDKPNGAWEWRVRFAPRSAGRWLARVRLDARVDGQAINLYEDAPHAIKVRAGNGLLGPLVAPGTPGTAPCMVASA